MELVVADSAGRDVALVSDFSLDMDAGWGSGVDNSFDLTVRGDAPLPGPAWRVYADGTEIGGRVEGFAVKAGRAGREVHWRGSSWAGVLERRLLWPDPGADWLTFAGDCNALLRWAVSRLDLGSLFTVPDGASGVTVSWRFSRDEPDAWTGLRLALRSVGMRLAARWSHGACRLSAERVADWEGRVDSDLVGFDIEQSLLPVNHAKAAGRGELAARQVVDLYADRDGRISGSRAMAGVFEVEEFIDANNAEGDSLAGQARDRLADRQGDGSVEVTVEDGTEFGLGDLVTARYYRPNVTVRAEISSRVTAATGAGAAVTYRATPAGAAAITSG